MLEVNFKRRASAQAKDIEVLEQELAFPISEKMGEFLLIYSGAVPEDNIFDLSHGKSAGIQKFIEIAQIPFERKNIAPWERGIELSPLPGTYPIAYLEGGNYLYVDETGGGEIWYFDHEVEGRGEFLSRSIEEFCSQVRPFSGVDIVFDKPRVLSVEINHELLKKYNIKRIY